MKVIIYGAAHWGNIAYDLCKLMQFEVIAFLDRDKEKQGKYFNDTEVKIYAPEEYNKIDDYENTPIIMTTKDSTALDNACQISKNIINFWNLKNLWLRLARKDFPKVQVNNINIEHCKLLDTREHLLEKFPQGLVMAEIGSFKGDYAQKILDICKPSKLYLIDAWEGQRWEQYYDVVKERFHKELESGQVEIRKGYSTEMLETFHDHELDWVYIDTVHDYNTTREELKLSHIKVKENGFICGHDYTNYNVESRMDYGVWSAVNEFMVNYNYSLQYMTMEPDGCKSFCLERLDR